MAAPKQYGVFSKEGIGRRIAYSPAEAVRYEYDGWTRVGDRLRPAPKAEAAEPAEQPTKSKTTSK